MSKPPVGTYVFVHGAYVNAIYKVNCKESIHIFDTRNGMEDFISGLDNGKRYNPELDGKILSIERLK